MADDPVGARLLNEFVLLGCAGIVLFTLCWLLVSLVLGPALAPMISALEQPIAVGEAPVGAGGSFVGGWGRVALLFLLFLAATAVGLMGYTRTVRARLVARGWIPERGELRTDGTARDRGRR